MAGVINDMPGNQDNQNNSNTSNTGNSSPKYGPDIDLLKSIDATLKDILQQSSGWSQSDARNAMPGRQYGPNTQSGNKWSTNRRYGSSDFKMNTSHLMDDFEDGLRSALLDAVLGSNFKENIQGILGDVADAIGVDVTDLGRTFGQEIGKSLLNTDLGRSISGSLNDAVNKAGSSLKDMFLDNVPKNERSGWESILNRQYQRRNTQGQHGAQSSQSSFGGRTAATGDHWTNASSSSIKVILDTSNLPIASDAFIVRFAGGSNRDSNLDLPDRDGQSFDPQQAASNIDTSKLADLAADSGDDIAGAMKSAGSSAGTTALAAKGGTALTAGGSAAGGTAVAGGSAAAAGGTTAVATTGAAAAGGTAAAGGAVSAAGAAAAVPVVGWVIAAVVVGLVALAACCGPAVDGLKELAEGASKSSKRHAESRKKNLDLEKERLAADVKTLVEEPFNILKEAAEEWYQVWDNQLRTITATQGYSKDDLYDLAGSFADRLRDEGLTSVISSADILQNLSKVLDGGLSNTVAEEFAYLATTLNAAVPTQDFFNYAEAYASLAANAIKDGAEEAEAIAYANSQLEQFANNVLYASRNLSGGFSTGLKDAQKLFEYSAQIATTAKTGNAAEISGVLTSIAAVAGAIAPDVADSLVDAVVKAAVGGNSSELVALRSLAHVNASNTEFLQMLASDPQNLFKVLIDNLASMQNMSNGNFMEVAERLSEVFGISMEAFARVDFKYLSQAIGSMDTASGALAENMSLLKAGETTTTAEQLKMQQINEYMLEEGLAYVMDNEAARHIQQHMWDEQLNRELMEATYAVELQGSALSFLEGISHTIENIINLLNPIGWLTKAITNIALTATDGAAQQSDLRQMLELGKVGRGSTKSLYNLTTRNKDLNLTDSLVGMMGGVSAYDAVHTGTKLFNAISDASIFSMSTSLARGSTQLGSILAQSVLSNMFTGKAVGSSYGWGVVSKSLASAASGGFAGLGYSGDSGASVATASNVSAKAESRFQEYLNTMNSFVSSNKTYDQWKASASSYGIKDFTAALEENGVTEETLKGAFQAQESQKGAEESARKAKLEEEFWTAGKVFWAEAHPAWRVVVSGYYNMIVENQADEVEELKQHTLKLDKINTTVGKFMTSWTDYYVNHTAYSDATLSAYDVAEIRNSEKDGYGDAVLALADALTRNSVDLKDPAVQTNVILAKLLLVAEQMLQQNAMSGGGSGSSLPTTFAGLGLGLME